MSEFHSISLDLDDQECVVKALEEMGYTPIVSQEAKNLHGYHGDVRKQKAHIIIPRSQVGSASNDVGFEKIDGKYIMHLSEYDQSSRTFSENKFKQLYNKNKVLKAVKKNSKLSVKSTQVRKDGSISVRVSVSSF